MFARTPTGDLDFSTHNLVIVTDGATCAAMNLQDKFATMLGEWFLDANVGVPYLQVLGVKNPDLAAITAMFRAIILDEPGIVSVIELNTTFNTKTRTFTYQFSAKYNDGSIITGGPGAPFYVTPPTGNT